MLLIKQLKDAAVCTSDTIFAGIINTFCKFSHEKLNTMQARGQWDPDNRKDGQGGRAWCSVKSPGQTSCRQTSPTSASFCSQSIMPSRSQQNLNAWGKKDTPSCLIRYRIGFLEYLLSNCTKVLADGHYRCCHYQVLKAIAERIVTAINTTKYHFTDSNRRPPQIF